MKEVPLARGVLRFDAFEVNLRNREARKHGFRIKLQDQPFRVLEILLQNAGELVTREELQRQIWPADTFVDFEKGLNNAVKRLRGALGDSAEHPLLIETISKRGYRFIAPVSVNGAQSAAVIEEGAAGQGGTVAALDNGEAGTLPPSSAPASILKRNYLLAALGLLALTAGAFGWGWHSQQGVGPIGSLAVLPLTNLSGDPAQEYFADGMTDALITELSQISALKVISRTSMMQYKKTDKSLRQIARELDVDAVVEGTVQRSRDRVRITAQLIQGATDKHIWASSYERSLQDVLSLQGEIANEIAEEIRVKVTPQEKLRMARVRPINLNAVEDYLQGRYHYQNAKDKGFHRGAEKAHEAELNQAIAFFRRAVAEDANYAPAYVGMGEIWGVPATFPYPPNSMAQPAREALKKALAIDPDLAEAYVDLGRIDYRYWNWHAMEQELKRAIELNPNLASAHVYYTYYLDAMGRLDEGMEHAERAKALEPGNDQVAWEFYCRRQFDRFIEMKRGDVERHAFGAMAHFDLGHGYERAHMYKEAVEEWEEAMSGFGYDDLTEDLRRGYRIGGFKGAMRQWVAGWETISRQGGTVTPDLLAYIYSILGDKDHAFAWLEKSLEMHTSAPPAFKVDPTYDDLRSDPRFAELERRVGVLR
jgi:TolB-like protein/DNA-binding winged helix-turn-helix (wHTH) protein